MKKLAALTFVACACAMAQDASQQIIALDKQWMSALAHKDAATLETLLAPEFTLADLGSSTARPPVPRADWLRNALTMNWSDLYFREIHATVFNDAAVVTGTLHFKMSGNGLPMVSDCSVMDLWVRRDGQWRVAMRRMADYSVLDIIRIVSGILIGIATAGAIGLLVRLWRQRRA